MRVTKRNGRLEEVDVDKFNKVVMWATEGISGVSASEVALNSKFQFFDKIKTTELMELSIKSAADLISEESPNYQYVAGHLINYHIRKEVYDGIEPLKLIDHVKKTVGLGYYDPELLDLYSDEEWDILETYIDHDRDYDMTYTAMEQWRGKYLVKNRVTGQLFETPQMAYILIAATLFGTYPKKTRLKWVKDYYDAISTHDISLPTPVMAGVRTPQRQFSSCVVINCDDSLDSINASTSAIVKYVSQKAGIGLNIGKIRAIGSKVRNGDTYHTGIVPFIKLFQSAVSSCSQGSIRTGSATTFYPFFHYEFEDLIVLKNNKGIEENRVRHLDYAVQFNKLAYERLLSNGNITLFSPNDVPELYESFFNNQEKFEKLYEEAEANPKLRKKTVKAIDLFTTFMQERKNTGRIYLMNVDHSNSHGSFDEKVAPIYQSNLCMEILLSNTPIQSIDGGVSKLTVKVKKEDVDEYKKWRSNFSDLLPSLDIINDKKFTVISNDERYDYNSYDYFNETFIDSETGSVALCTLSAINWGKIREPKDFEKPCTLAVRALDALLDYQSYPLNAAKANTMMYRNLGIGIINLAYFIAKNGVKYSDGSANKLIDEYAEAWSYYLIKASVDLAKEKGACIGNSNTKYSNGILPVDTRKKEIDEIITHTERMPWNKLREDLKTYGIRNATIMAVAPTETSSQVSNATNGIEPPRSYVSVKQSKDGVLKQVVPEYRRLKNKYDLLWDQESPEGYLKICAILQKYIDQSISTNISYNPEFYADKQLPMSELLKHILLAYKYGLKTIYYMNTLDNQSEVDVDKLIKEHSNDIVETDCDSCIL